MKTNSRCPYMILPYLVATVFIVVGAYFLIRLFDSLYAIVFKKPAYVHFYWNPRRLSKEDEKTLRDFFPFYIKLTKRQQRFFQHRLVNFMEEKDFEGRNGLEINSEIKTRIGATAVMLTFGMRDYYLGVLQKIIVYPDSFHSNTTGTDNKGEFNPLMRVLVLSWKDFEEGFADETDKVNLGIHEFTHVLQHNSRKFRSVGGSIFMDANRQLQDLLKDARVRQNLLDSHFFRHYAYTNQFEFLAVMVEYFIESPREFREKFPLFYEKIREMLNFNFAGY